MPTMPTLPGNPPGLAWCQVCGNRLGHGGARWRHLSPQRTGAPWEHSPVPVAVKPTRSVMAEPTMTVNETIPDYLLAPDAVEACRIGHHLRRGREYPCNCPTAYRMCRYVVAWNWHHQDIEAMERDGHGGWGWPGVDPLCAPAPLDPDTQPR